MKNIIIVSVFLLFISVVGFPKSNLLELIVIDQVFDSYRSKIPWKEERAHLDNFAIFLKKNPNCIGYVFVFTKENESPKKQSLVSVAQQNT